MSNEVNAKLYPTGRLRVPRIAQHSRRRPFRWSTWQICFFTFDTPIRQWYKPSIKRVFLKTLFIYRCQSRDGMSLHHKFPQYRHDTSRINNFLWRYWFLKINYAIIKLFSRKANPCFIAFVSFPAQMKCVYRREVSILQNSEFVSLMTACAAKAIICRSDFCTEIRKLDSACWKRFPFFSNFWMKEIKLICKNGGLHRFHFPIINKSRLFLLWLSGDMRG